MFVGQVKTGSQKVYPAGPPGFVAWLQDKMPQVYESVKIMQPELVEPERLKVIAIPITRPGKKVRTRPGRRQACEMIDYEGFNYQTGNYQLYGLGQEPAATTAEKSTLDTWVDRLTSMAAPLLNVYQQKEMVDLQIERAKQGLPPLPDDALAAKVKVTTGIDKYIPWIAGGAGVLVVLYMVMQSRPKQRR